MKLPKLCRNKTRNRAFVLERGKKIYLGKWGAPETEAAYQLYIHNLTAKLPTAAPANNGGGVTIVELTAAFFEARADYYVKNGRQTNQLARFRTAAEYPVRYYGDLPVRLFGPKKLLECRAMMEESGRFARKYINTLITCFRGIIKFGVEHELAPPEILVALQAVSPLKRGRSVSREMQPVEAVPPQIVDATCELLSSTVAAMVKVQRYTGMRPGEICAMRAGDVYMGDDIWIYTVRSDKTDYRRPLWAKKRIPLGPKAQAVLFPFLLAKEGEPDAWSRTKYPTAELGKYTKTVWKGTARPTASRVAEASLFTANGTDGKTLERLGYSKEEIDEAQRVENRTLSLRGLIYRTGEAQPGYCDEGKIADVMRKAQYLAQREEYEPGRRVARAAGELSTVDIPNVLANVINKSMLNGVQMVDDPTDTISRVVAARDFRPQYFINLLASGEFADVKANGEVENLALSDTRYENAAKMRGMEVRIGYETIANDDMNAIQEIPKIMGRKAGLRKQKIFFEAFTAAAAASALNNLPGVASNPALNLAGLDKGCAAFRGLKDDDADPIGARPKFLIVPPALEGTALNLITASEIVSGSTGDATGLAIVPNIKRYAARFEVVTSEYLGATGPFASNWGDKKWMLLADPIDVPLMILSYYQNQKTPTIKTVYGDTEIDGLRYVLYWGVGVSVAEKKSCVVSNPS